MIEAFILLTRRTRASHDIRQRPCKIADRRTLSPPGFSEINLPLKLRNRIFIIYLSILIFQRK